MVDRAGLPDWPRGMSLELAARYLGVSVADFRQLGICPLNIKSSVIYDRRSLDLYADRLSGLADAPTDAPDLDARIAAFGAS